MNKAEIYRYLTEQNVRYEVTEHSAVFSMAELDEVQLPYPEWDAKNLYLDAAFSGNKIGVHPNDNTATVWMCADELLDMLRRHGNSAEYTVL